MRLKEPLTLKPYFGKQVIERPRRGSRTALSAKARSYGRIVDYGDGPEYEGFTRLPVSRKQEGYNKKLGDKDFSDVLGPLHNYLRSSCGRPWDDVYSEIAYHIGRFTRREGLRHIIDAHVDVAVNTYRGVDGNVWICDKHGVHKVGGFYYDFYVEPETGILREAANYRKWRSIAREKEAAKQLEVVPIAEGREYRKIDGIWFYQEFAMVEETELVRQRFYRGRDVAPGIGSVIGSRTEKTKVVTLKRQAGKKDLKALGLRN